MRTITSKGAESLAFAIVEQAVQDMKALVDRGVIRNGKCIYESKFVWSDEEKMLSLHTTWPKNHKVCGYKTVNQIKELIYFFESGTAAKILAGLGSTINPQVMYKKISK